MDIGLFNALELLTEVGATANPVCVGPDHLKEGKPNGLAWTRSPCWGVSDQPLQVGRGTILAAGKIQPLMTAA